MSDRRNKRPGGAAPFWVVSGIGHAAVLAALIYFGPVREFVFEREVKLKPDIRKRDEALAEIIEKIRDVQAERLRARVALLGAGADRMRINLLNKQGRHHGFEYAQKAAAFVRIADRLKKLEELQSARLTLHRKHQGKDPPKESAKLVQLQNSQIRGHLEDIDAALPLLPEGEGREETIKLARGALETHATAADFERWYRGATSGKNRHAGRVAEYERRTAKRKKDIRGLETRKAETAGKLEAHGPALAGLEKAHRDAKAKESAARAAQSALDKDRRTLGAAEYKKRRAALDKARRAAQNRTRSLSRRHAQEKRRGQALGREVRNLENQIARQRQQLAREEGELAKSRAGHTKALAEHEKKTGEVTWWVQKEIKDREAAQQAFLKYFNEEQVAKTLRKDKDDKPFQLVTGIEKPSTPYKELSGLDIVGLFDKSGRLIGQLTLDYRAIKAIQLAKLRNLAIDRALEQIQPVSPLPTKVNRELLRMQITDPKMIEPHKRQVENVKLSVEEKIELAEKLLIDVERWLVEAGGSQEMNRSLEDILAQRIFDEQSDSTEGAERAALLKGLTYEERQKAQSQMLAKLAELAKEDEDVRFKDLAEAMRADIRRRIDMQDLTGEDKGREGKAKDLFAKLEQGARPGVDLNPNVPGILGRKLTADGTPAEWLYVDTWYTIGPFPNPMRKHLHTKFPPETIVDLDATYVGKEGRTVRWEFVQGRRQEVMPAHPEEYAIYYAFTEIYSDRPRDVWISVGSDDKANVWINDLPVWISGDHLKAWRINEGFRKIHLRQGFNKILYRVENGHFHIGFSLSIHAKRE